MGIGLPKLALSNLGGKIVETNHVAMMLRELHFDFTFLGSVDLDECSATSCHDVTGMMLVGHLRTFGELH